jgi:6,7-dimethyl-8-ribityllumazine synthase
MSQTYLIIEARFYTDLLDALAEGAIEAIEAAGAQYERISVPGALEIPGAIAIADASSKTYAGYIALGCVIRGETSHYDTVCNESARGIMNLTLEKQLAIGNGIITVENSGQAWARADKMQKNKGGDAARAALAMAALKKDYS